VIIGSSNLVLERYEKFDDEKRKKYIGYINESAKQTHKLLENLLEWALIQTNEMKFTPGIVNIHDLSMEITSLLNENATNKKITLRSSVEKDSFVLGDFNMLQLIIRNLVSNAIKFTNKGGLIEITSEVEDNYEKIVVSDTGIGMTKDEIDNLFKIDAKSSKLGTAKEKGTGLGLILCKDFIERHKGYIDVTSEIGKGSQFCVRLPKAHPSS